LQAYRKASLLILSMAIGLAVKIVSAYFLMGISQIGIYGAAISTLLCNTVAVGMNLYFIDRHTGVRFDMFSLSFAPMLASFFSVGAAFAVWRFLCERMSSGGSLLFSILLCGILYLWIGGKMGVYRERDLQMLPYGEKIVGLLLALGFIKNEKGKDRKNEQRGYYKKAS